jgi:hypothetical protein
MSGCGERKADVIKQLFPKHNVVDVNPYISLHRVPAAE